jgi:CPA2 family monovalent cation:H+ antiporter-2
VILLMFGVGLHFSLKDLLSVWRIAVPGAIGQSVFATGLGAGVGWACGWGAGESVLFGLALAVASTVVLVRGLMDLGVVESLSGHVAIGWLIVEDLLTVLILVLLPAMAGGDGAGSGIVSTLLVTLGKVAVLTILVGTVGVWLVPRLLALVARANSRELFTLGVLAIALGIAWASSHFFGVSMALGAFLGGMVVAQSDLSHQAAADALPLRDAFAVLFFVSVGMLFDPVFALAHPGLVLVTVAIVVVGKPLAAIAIVLLLGRPVGAALTVGAGLAQVGEFSFILMAFGRELKLVEAPAQNAVLVAALVSITMNPLIMRSVAPLEKLLRRLPRFDAWQRRRAEAMPEEPLDPQKAEGRRDHVILCGHGRVGSQIAKVLTRAGLGYVVIEQDRNIVERLRDAGIEAMSGDASHPLVLEHAGLAASRLLLVATPDPFATRQIIAHARSVRPDLPIVARVHNLLEEVRLAEDEAIETVVGESELAYAMARHMLLRIGFSSIEAEAQLLDVKSHRGVAGTGITRATVPPDSGAAGRRLLDLQLGDGCLVVTIGRGGEMLVPNGQTILRVGDTLLVVADRDGLVRLDLALRPAPGDGVSERAPRPATLPE